jgi:signal transduction histidine kinase/ligand-binding sensor domain-containing protein
MLPLAVRNVVRFMPQSIGLRTRSLLAIVLIGIGAKQQFVMATGFVNVRTVGDLRHVRALVTDSFGFVWSASSSGICRTDGKSWICPSPESATALGKSTDGRIWVARPDGTLAYVSVSGPLSVRTSPVGGEIVGVVETQSGGLLVAAQGGLYLITSARRCALNSDCSGTLVLAQSITAISYHEGVALVGRGSEIFSIADSRATRIGSTNQTVTALGALSHGRWLAATGYPSSSSPSASGWHIINGTTIAALPVARTATTRSIITRAGSVYVATLDSGLLRIDHSQIGSTVADGVVRINGLVHHEATSTTLDQNQDLWVGTASGVSHVRFEYPLRTFTRAERLPASAIFSLSEDVSGKIWMATTDGVAVWQPHKRDAYGEGVFEAIGPAEGFKYLDIRAVATFGNDVVVGGLESGLFKVQTGHPVPYLANLDLRHGVHSIRKRNAGGLWIAPSAGGLGWVQDGAWHEMFLPELKGTSRVFDLAESPRGDVWLALAKGGVVQISGDRIFRHLKEMQNTEMLAILPQDDGGVLVGTKGAGLLKIRGDSVNRVSVTQGLPDSSIFGLVDDGAGRIWMTGSWGISAIERSQLERGFASPDAPITCVSFGTRDGVPGEPTRAFFPTSLKSKDGTLWFSTLAGVVQIDPKALIGASTSSKPIVENLRVNGVLFDSTIESASHLYQIGAGVSTPYYRYRDRVTHAYRMEGLMATWQPLATGNGIHLERVPPGQYRLVVASTIDGGTRQESSVVISLPILWYEKWQVRLLLFAALVTGVFTAFSARTRRFRREHETVLAERGRIAGDIHDSLEQDLIGLRMQLQAASMALSDREPTVRGYLARSNALLDDAKTDLRNSIWGLRLGRLQSQEAIAMLRQRLDRSTSGTSIDLVVQQVGPDRAISALAAPHLISIAREAVANALKHASPTRIDVVLDLQSPDTIVVRVHDNGSKRGESDGSDATGLGIAAMRGRATAMNGTFSVATSPDGEGTTIEVRIPAIELRD